jgi:hypothetical protein
MFLWHAILLSIAGLKLETSSFAFATSMKTISTCWSTKDAAAINLFVEKNKNVFLQSARAYFLFCTYRRVRKTPQTARSRRIVNCRGHSTVFSSSDSFSWNEGIDLLTSAALSAFELFADAALELILFWPSLKSSQRSERCA